MTLIDAGFFKSREIQRFPAFNWLNSLLAPLRCGGTARSTQQLAFGWLYFQHFGAEVGHHAGAVRPRDHASEIEYAHTLEHAGASQLTVIFKLHRIHSKIDR